MKKSIPPIILLLLFLSTGCCVQESGSAAWNNASYPDKKAENATISDVIEWENDMFNRYYSTDSDQADAVLQAIVTAIESQDSAMLKALFSKYAVDTSVNLDDQILCLFDFYEGEMVSFCRYGPGSHSTKEENMYVKEIFVSYDIHTTSGDYRIAVKFCTIDSSHPDNVGIGSLYIINQKNSDLNYAYWGGNVWNAGIHIEGQYLKETGIKQKKAPVQFQWTSSFIR